MRTGIVGSLIGLAFALVWLWIGADALAGSVGTAIGAAGTLVVGGAIVWLLVSGGRPAPAGTRFDRRAYLLAVLFELVAMAAAVNLLARLGRPELIWPAIGLVVGLHFIGLWRATGLAKFLALTAMMTVVNLVALAAPLDPSTRQAVAGFGSSLSLLSVALA